LHLQLYTTRSDALGSVRTTLDDAGTVLATAAYDPWGGPQGELVGPFGFTGELHHGGQVYVRARWYTPGSGTFPTRDPFAGFPEMPYSLHAYQYAYSAPTMWTDPSGEVIPRCPIGYHPMMRADGSFGGCARTGQVPPWVSDVSLGLPIPGTAGHLGGRTLGHLGREGLETCINLIGGTLVWILTQTHVETQTRRQSFEREVLVVGEQPPFPYATGLAALHPNWHITGSSYGDGSNAQIKSETSDNLTIVEHVDATRLESGSYTGSRQFDDIIFNAPRAAQGWKTETARLIDHVLRSGHVVLKPGGAVRFSSTDFWPGGPHLNGLLNNRPPGYVNTYKRRYEADPRFYVPYTFRRNDGDRLDPQTPVYWFGFQKG